jgi:hypothetical protein
MTPPKRGILWAKIEEMPMCPLIRFAFCALPLAVSGGCTLVSGIAGSSVVAGDEHGGTISRVTTFTQAGALAMAGSWCQRYGFVAQGFQVIFATDSMDFACVPQPVHEPQSLIGPPDAHRPTGLS